MKNFMNFKEFSVNEGSTWSNSDWEEYYGKTRETKLAKTLQEIANDIRQETRKTGDSDLSAPAWLLKRGLASLFNLGASAADWKKGKKKKSGEENKEREEAKKEWGDFIKNSERMGLSKFGPDWSLLNPRTPEERRYSEKVRKKELELIDKMTRI